MRQKRNKSDGLLLWFVERAVVVYVGCKRCGEHSSEQIVRYATSGGYAPTQSDSRIPTVMTCSSRQYSVWNTVMVYFVVLRIMSTDVSTRLVIFSKVRGMLSLQSAPDPYRRSPHSFQSGVLRYKEREFLVCMFRGTAGEVDDEKPASSACARRRIHLCYYGRYENNSECQYHRDYVLVRNVLYNISPYLRF